MDVRLVERIGPRDYVILAYGKVEGDAAAAFVRSLVKPGVIAYCTDGHTSWRWKFLQAKTKTIDKIVTYGTEPLTLTDQSSSGSGPS